MRNLLFLFFLLTAVSCFASDPDSAFHRHIFSVSMFNGLSQQFFDGPTKSRPTNTSAMANFAEANSNFYTPMYAMHVQLHYSLGISPVVRIETGIGYLLSGYVDQAQFEGGFAGSQGTLTMYYYQGNITLPLYVKLIKPMPRGAFTCTVGPDFTLPVHEFYQNKDINSPLAALIATSGHYRYTTSQTAQTSSMGVYLKLAWEKQLTSNLSVNIGPAVDFFELIPFHTYSDTYVAYGYFPYQFYAGLDVAVNFGLKGKK